MSLFRSKAFNICLVGLLSLTATAQNPYLDGQRPITLSADRQLFLDDSLVESRSNVTRVLHQPVKEPEPILVGDQPWENWTVDIFGTPSIHFDDAQHIYRLWYTAYDVAADNYYICYATSMDGVHWTKPILGIKDHNGSKQNNIVNTGRVHWPNSTVLIDEHEANPARRYKSLSFDFAPTQSPETSSPVHPWPRGAEELKKGRSVGVALAFSPDGLNWTLYDGNPVLKDPQAAGDTHFLLGWDDNYHGYVGYFRPSYAASGGPRVIGFSTSHDFTHWTTPEIILRPDSQDPITDEFYGMPVLKYQGRYIGFLWIYHNSPNPALVSSPNMANLAGAQQTLETQLTYSEDGKHFIRVGDRQLFLPAGPRDSWDRGMVTASDMIVHGNELWIYYGGWGPRHSGDDFKLVGTTVNGHRVMGALGLAKLRLDGFVSLHAGASEGMVLTRQIRIGDRTLVRVNADAGHGMVSTELLNDKFEPIPGFTRADAQVIEEDLTSKEVSWRGHSDLSSLRGQVIRIRFYLQDADLYSVALQ